MKKVPDTFLLPWLIIAEVRSKMRSLSKGHLKHTLVVVGLCFILVLVMVQWPDWEEERTMRARYDTVSLGGTLSEAESSLGISEGVLSYDGDTAPYTLDEELWPEDPWHPRFFTYYPGKRYAIVLHYDSMYKGHVTGKGFLKLKEGSFSSRMRRVRRKLMQYLPGYFNAVSTG